MSANAAIREIYSQFTKCLQEQVQHPNEGILVMMEDENWANRWTALFANFPPDSQLAADINQLRTKTGVDHLKLEIEFPPRYPADPPFVRLVTPRFRFHTGHVTVGGSLCIETLVNTGTPTGWQPNICIWSILVQCKQLMIDGGARIDFSRVTGTTGQYSMQEARAAFTRVAGQHGWMSKTDVASTGLYVPHYPLESNPWWDKYQVQTLEVVDLPGEDPKDNSIGTMRHKEAIAIASIFAERWKCKKPSGGDFKIVAIKRVQNMRVFDKFYAKLCDMAYLNKGHGVNEKWMFHGLRNPSTVQPILEHGFDTRLSERGFLGAGLYVAENSDLANSYTAPDSQGMRYIFYGRCLLGVTENVSPASLRGQSYTTYHETETRSIIRNYDSESSIMHSTHNFSALFSNDQAYPDYMICYTA